MEIRGLYGDSRLVCRSELPRMLCEGSIVLGAGVGAFAVRRLEVGGQGFLEGLWEKSSVPRV